MKNELPNEIKKIFDIFKSSFGEERVDMKKVNNGEDYQIILHYPEFEISNAKGERHTIRNLFVYITIDGLDFAFSDLEGLKSTYTEKEFVSGYTHSHLPESTLNNIKCFCAGDGDFQDAMARICIPAEDFATEEEFFYAWEMFTMVLDNYIKWESIEGIPHRRISAIKYRTNRGNLVDNHFSTILRMFHRNLESGSINLDTVFINNELKVVFPNEKEWLEISSILISQLDPEIINKYRVKNFDISPDPMDSEGINPMNDQEIENAINQRRISIKTTKFKGKEYPFEIIERYSGSENINYEERPYLCQEIYNKLQKQVSINLNNKIQIEIKKKENELFKLKARQIEDRIQHSIRERQNDIVFEGSVENFIPL